SGKSVLDSAGGVTQQLAQRDTRLPFFICRQSRRHKACVDVGIEFDGSDLGELHDCERERGLADGAYCIPQKHLLVWPNLGLAAEIAANLVEVAETGSKHLACITASGFWMRCPRASAM